MFEVPAARGLWGLGELLPWSLGALWLLTEIPQTFRDRWVFLRRVKWDGDRVGGDSQGREFHPFGASCLCQFL